MQRPVRSYRGAVHLGSHLARSQRTKNDDKDDQLFVSHSNLDEIEDNSNDNDTTVKSKDSSMLSSIAVNTDLESIVRNLRPLGIHEEKSSNSQMADLPHLKILNDQK